MNAAAPSPLRSVTAGFALACDAVAAFPHTVPHGMGHGHDRLNRSDRESWHRCSQSGVKRLPAPESHAGDRADIMTTIVAPGTSQAWSLG